MIADVDGFVFPKVDEAKCIRCQKCRRVCAFQNVPVDDRKPLATYAAINKDMSSLLKSTSGGVFFALASWVFRERGVVFGCAYNDDMEPQHICVDDLVDARKLQGSKYVQSKTNVAYKEVQRYLSEGKWVLFTGTPCQVAALKSFLGKDYDRLVTADLICHGVPSVSFFKGYICHLEKKYKGRVIELRFRDKARGWGLVGKLVYHKNGKLYEKPISPKMSYYYHYFLKGYTYRESCYECKYACASREGDLTLGDFWGIREAHPEVETKSGVSVLMVNTLKGEELIGDLSEQLALTPSTFEKASKKNNQLNRPTAKPQGRDAVLQAWHDGGHQAVARMFYRQHWRTIMKLRLNAITPPFAKSIMKKFFVGKKSR
jgi:coenzyme F420-reducing hydrogenase beta subunit